MAFRDNLLRAMAKAGFNQPELARHLGVTTSAVNQWCAGTAAPATQRLPEIARALGVSVGELLTEVKSDVKRPPSNVRVHNAPALPDFQALPRDVPVLGTAQGGKEGALVLNMEEGPIDWARRPQGLSGVQTVFAIYCEGDSMAPWRQPGELIYVSKTRPAQIGSHVVVVVESEKPGEPPSSYVKRLVRRTAEKLELEQYNPPTKICFAMSAVREILRVIEWSEVLGI